MRISLLSMAVGAMAGAITTAAVYFAHKAFKKYHGNGESPSRCESSPSKCQDVDLPGSQSIQGDVNSQQDSASLDHKTSLSDFNLMVVLGKGSFGQVRLAQNKISKEVVAIKAVTKHDDHNDIEETVLRISVHCPFLVHGKGFFSNEEIKYYAMEYLSGESFNKFIPFCNFEVTRTRFYGAEIFLGVKFLHKNKIVHNDIKPGNILVDHCGHAKLADFGLCQKMNDGGLLPHGGGTALYVPPEVWYRQPCGFPKDCWALGVLLYHMYTSCLPFNNEKEICYSDPKYYGHIPGPLCGLLKGLLTKDPGHRLILSDIQCHKFFEKIDWNQLENRTIKPPLRPFDSPPWVQNNN